MHGRDASQCTSMHHHGKPSSLQNCDEKENIPELGDKQFLCSLVPHRSHYTIDVRIRSRVLPDYAAHLPEGGLYPCLQKAVKWKAVAVGGEYLPRPLQLGVGYQVIVDWGVSLLDAFNPHTGVCGYSVRSCFVVKIP
jgi:hypothetical protein